MNDPLAALPIWALALLREARVARIGMIGDEGGPRVLPVTFVLHEGRLWTAVDRKPKRDPSAEPARLSHLRSRPHAAITVDRYADDWSRLAWVQVLGRAAVLDVADHEAVLTALTAKYQQYVDQPPPGPLIRIAPTRALSWRYSDGL